MTELKQHFDRDGYVVIKGFLDEQQCGELISKTQRFIKELVPTIPIEYVYYEDKADKTTLKQVQKMYEFDDYYLQLATSNALISLAEELLGGPVDRKNMQYFNKVPRIGKSTPAHQDGYYFKIKPQQAVTMWLSLVEADENNGAVCYIPGSHKGGMRAHNTTGTLGFSQGISDWSVIDDENEIQMKAQAGDMLVHHSLTIHCANANLSENARPSVGFIFYRQDAIEDKAAHDSHQLTLNKNLAVQGKI